MRKTNCRIILWIAVIAFVLVVPLSNMVFAYGGDGDGDGDATDFSASSPGSSSGFWGFSQEDIYEIFGRPATSAFRPEEKSTIENTWGRHVKEKPKHWTKKHWGHYKKKRQAIFRHQKKESDQGQNTSERNCTIAEGTGDAAAGAGAVVGAVAGPVAAPVIVIISIVGDGVATTCGNLADGKGIVESVKAGIKKGACTATLSKVSTGSKAVDAFIGYIGGMIFDKASGAPSGKPTKVTSATNRQEFGKTKKTLSNGLSVMY